jgi:hypothetical protein
VKIEGQPDSEFTQPQTPLNTPVRQRKVKQVSKLDLMFMGPSSTADHKPHHHDSRGPNAHSTTSISSSTTDISIDPDEKCQIGDTHTTNGNYGEAVKCHKRALAMHKKESGGLQNEQTAKHYDKLGSAYHDSGAANRAATYYHKALTIRMNLHGEDHMSTARSLDKVGSAYAELGDYERALNFHHKAKHVKKKLLGRETEETAKSFWNIGDVHYRKQDFDTALTYFNKAKDVQECISESHPDLIASRKSIALAQKGKDEAENDT